MPLIIIVIQLTGIRCCPHQLFLLCVCVLSFVYFCFPLIHATHHTLPHSLTLQDLGQTPLSQNPASVRGVQDPVPTSAPSSSSSSFPSVASYISDWEQRFPLDSGSQSRQPGTPQFGSRTPTPCHGASSVGRRRGRCWAPETEVPHAASVYELNKEAGTRVSVLVAVPKKYSTLRLKPLASALPWCRAATMEYACLVETLT